MYYNIAIVCFLMVTFYTIFINKTNREIIRHITEFRCDGQTTSRNNNNNNNNDTSLSNSTQTYLGISQSTTTYLVLGFHLLNSSVLATVMLGLVKTLRALYARTGNRFSELRLPQRLPIMGCVNSRVAQALLSLYILVVLVFAVAGVTYSLHIEASGITFLIAVLLLTLNAVALRLLRWNSNRRHQQRSKMLKAEIETQQSELDTEKADSVLERGGESKKRVRIAPNDGIASSSSSSVTRSDFNNDHQHNVEAAATSAYQVNRGYGSIVAQGENEKNASKNNKQHKQQQQQQALPQEHLSSSVLRRHN